MTRFRPPVPAAPWTTPLAASAPGAAPAVGGVPLAVYDPAALTVTALGDEIVPDRDPDPDRHALWTALMHAAQARESGGA